MTHWNSLNELERKGIKGVVILLISSWTDLTNFRNLLNYGYFVGLFWLIKTYQYSQFLFYVVPLSYDDLIFSHKPTIPFREETTVTSTLDLFLFLHLVHL